jgi:hypothetical protein
MFCAAGGEEKRERGEGESDEAFRHDGRYGRAGNVVS